MAEVIVNFAEERLIRRAPDYPLSLDTCDESYLRSCFTGIDEAFHLPPDEQALPGAPLCFVPARALMRRLIMLKRRLQPTCAEQRIAYGKIWSAVGLLNTAIAMASERTGPGGASQQHR